MLPTPDSPLALRAWAIIAAACWLALTPMAIALLSLARGRSRAWWVGAAAFLCGLFAIVLAAARPRRIL